jgi:indole-3-glycerol phosphate synthase
MIYSGLIADFKRYSPHHGEVWGRGLPVDAWAASVAHADALSVIAHPDWGGSMADVEKAREDGRPLIAKHLRTKSEVIDAARIGVDGVLFCLRAMRNRDPLRVALSLGLDVLAEVHEISEVQGLPSCHAVVLNRRDILTGTLVRERYANLLPLVPEGLPVIAASGYTDEIPPGADAVLVSTFLAEQARG